MTAPRPHDPPEPGAGDARHAPATARNAGPILDVLRGLLPRAGTVLEIASGTGEHVARFAPALPTLVFQPTDMTPEARASIAAHTRALAASDTPARIRPPLDLDVLAEAWPVARADAVLCINMIHIAPWAATRALMRGTAQVLPTGGPLILYGPFLREGVPTAPGNIAFDLDLKRRDSAWGLRDLGSVAHEAAEAGLGAPRVIAMPANNLIVAFTRLNASP